MVTKDNYEEYMMLDADGELTAAAAKALQAFFADHPSLAAESAVWQSLRLQPDPQVVYTGKENLLKPEPKRVALGWKTYTMAAAAALLLLVFIPILWRNSQQTADSGKPALSSKTWKPVTIPAKDTAVTTAATVPAKAVAPTSARLPVRIHPHTVQPTVQSALQDSLPALAKTEIQLFATPPGASHPVQAQPQALETAIVIHEKGAQQHEAHLPHIQLAAANKPAFELLKRGLEERITQVSAAARSIRDVPLSITLDKGKVNLHF